MVLGKRGKPEHPKKNLLDQNREQTTNGVEA